MLIGVTKETLPGETRVAATPTTVKQLIKLGYDVVVESGAGQLSTFADEAYAAAGARIGTADNAWGADVVFRVNGPTVPEVQNVRDGSTLVSLLAPARNEELVEVLAARPITALAMDAVPRISRAQSLDVLSPAPPSLRAQSRALPCLHQHRLHPHLLPQDGQMR
ncbi:hypothetical protein [Streptomyces brasiliensis]|uniref:proton-translocating NAD(P)(+) transhydrogenase n=1 Tax=Streptomyces brasiliensis TaxID=1954 RepID=A0A917L6L1_9ACTN|nr:hypothetical protein GCM10010121_069210 [Streptomyces brasiliensis]